MNLRTLVRKVKPIARRDELITALRAKLAKAHTEARRREQELIKLWQQDHGRPSFYYKHREALRAKKLATRYGRRHPIWAVNGKLAGYEFARTYGIPVPRIYGQHADPGEIDWRALPDEFVIKTLHGASGAGVLPLIREDGHYQDLLGHNSVLTGDEIVALLRTRIDEGRASASLLIEELLHSPYADDRIVPLDVKIYSFYGTVGMIMVRDANGSRDHHEVRARYFDPSGEDLRDVMSHVGIDPSLPGPLHLHELVDAAERLSAALPVPFVRLDFYEKNDGIVFGEITPSPGGSQLPRADMDRKLGELWEDAEARIRTQHIEAGVLDLRHGALEPN